MSDQQVTLLYDAAGAPISSTFAPITSRPAQALTTPQGGLLTLGSDYAGRAQAPKVDAQGNQYVVAANPAGGTSQVYTGQPTPGAASQYGTLTMARQDSPSPSAYFPLMLDMQMALNVHHKSKPTFRAIAVGVTCSAGKSLMSLVNAGTMVLRINECDINVPQGGYAGGLLGASSITYYPLILEMRRITSHTPGAATATVTPISGDTGDTLSSGVTVYSGAAAGATVNTFHRKDAMLTAQAALCWYARGDQNEKAFVIRPGEGVTITCISNGTINSMSGGGTTTAAIDLELTFTQTVS